MILTIVSMVLITGNALGSGLIWTLGHLDLFVKEIVEVWMETVIKKQHRGHSVGRRKTLFKQKELYRIPQALVEEIMTAVNIVCFS